MHGFARHMHATFMLMALPSVALVSQPFEVIVVGDSTIPRPRIQSLATVPDPDTAIARIARAYASIGFLDVEVGKGDSNRLIIDPRQRYRIDRVAVLDSASVDTTLPGVAYEARRLSGEWFDVADVTALASSILRILDQRGYALAGVRTQLAFHPDTPVVDVEFHVDRGAIVRIARVRILGSTTTRHSLIVAAAGIDPDQIFTPDLTRLVQRRVERLGLFSVVEEPRLVQSDEGLYALAVTVTDANVNTFDGILGFQPAASAEGRPSLLGQIAISLGNVFGSGRRIALQWSRQSDVGSRLDIRYGEPYFLDLPINLDLGFWQAQEEKTPFLLNYARRGITGAVSYGLTDALRAGADGTIAWTVPQFDSTVSCDRQVSNSRLSELGLTLMYDTRVEKLNPVEGVEYSTRIAYGSRTPTGMSRCDTLYPTSEGRRRIELDMEAYLPMARLGSGEEAVGTIVGTTGLHFREVNAHVVEEGDLYRLGGSSTIRGYREGEFRGTRAAWGSIEIRLILDRRSYAAAFADLGYFSRPFDARRPLVAASEALVPGYGLGAQFSTPLGLARFSYALGRGDTFATGKVYFGLINQF